jgi:hypothetical protein
MAAGREELNEQVACAALSAPTRRARCERGSMMPSRDDGVALAKLRLAAMRGATEEAGRLVAAGADINSKDRVRIRSAARARCASPVHQSLCLLFRPVADA